MTTGGCGSSVRQTELVAVGVGELDAAVPVAEPGRTERD